MDENEFVSSTRLDMVKFILIYDNAEPNLWLSSFLWRVARLAIDA